MVTKNKNVCAGAFAKKIKCGRASEIFSSPSLPEDFKWNSPVESGAPMVRLYKVAGAPINECSPFKL